MRPISAAQRDNVLSLLSSGLSTKTIAAQTGGHPKKLTPTDQRAVLSLVRIGKASDAVAAAKHINARIMELVTIQTIRNMLKEDGLKAYVKKKRPYLSPRHRKARLVFA
ncbi:hypothetical protein M422DRAFT_264509 [Sphaerobolus stellatus SS14]|uniref:Transposase Tc1-like domain-containing protein n=1 Tax=Sphaerobolus stellatus (strain SS14) TaxID=990650 RepID=A0A0C9TTF6_SPHS4|nr:hypothetical protein M422DRAFT_264509 [Sphaerobolus stellatus SS14]